MQTPKRNVRGALVYVLIVVGIVIGTQFLLDVGLGSSPVYVVVSRSMVPTLEVGDLVVVQKVPFSDVHVGDVIVYARPSSTGSTCTSEDIVHRVVAVTLQGLITQGDDRATNPAPDEPGSWPPVSANCLKGRVILAVPYLGLVSMTVPYPYNYALVLLILLFVFLTEVRPRKDSRGPDGGEQGGAPTTRR